MLKSYKGLLAVLAIAAIALSIGGWKFPDISSALEEINAPDISAQAEQHILHGDKRGGGHLHGTGKPCKTEFPQEWAEEDILDNVRKVAANDNLSWRQEKNGYHVATQMVDDVRIRVVLDRDKDSVVTAYPVNLKSNACPSNNNKRRSRANMQRSVQLEEPANDNSSAKTYNFNQ